MTEMAQCATCDKVLTPLATVCPSCGAATESAAIPAAPAGGIAPLDPVMQPYSVPPPPPPPVVTGAAPVAPVGQWAVSSSGPLGLHRFIDDSAFVSFDELLTSDERIGSISALYLITLLVVGITFMIWCYRAYANLEPLGATNVRHTKGLAVVAWFLPIANLFISYQVMASIWVGSDPEREEVKGEWWKTGKRDLVMKVWCGAPRHAKPSAHSAWVGPTDRDVLLRVTP